MNQLAVLVLEDGSIFRGISIGKPGVTVGEVVFNTAMTGYQEILSDPSYAKQIVTLTYPHIGNTGITEEDEESASIFAAGLVVRDATQASSWRSQKSLSDYLYERNIVAIADIDTRRLTRLLRSKGAQRACIYTDDTMNAEEAIKRAQAFPGLQGMDLAKEVSAKQVSQWRQGTWRLSSGLPEPMAPKQLKYKVAAYDYGIKRNILRILVDLSCDVSVYPAQTPVEEILKTQPDGVFLSNGPGDPEPCDYAVKAIQTILQKNIPVFGICLGHQLLALASGAKTVKMKFGHHGANHPVQELSTGKVMISSQNHGFAVDEASLPTSLVATHRSLFDGSLQGIHRTDKPAFGFQGHPEASPGPHEMAGLFNHFIELMKKHQR